MKTKGLTQLCHKLMCLAVAFISIVCLFTPSACCEDIEVTNILESYRKDLQASIDGLLVLVSRPVVAGGSYSSDQEYSKSAFHIFKIPFNFKWKKDNSAWHPIISGSIGRLTNREELYFDRISDVSHFEVQNIVLGGGVEILLPYNLTLTPVFSLGYSHVKNYFEYRSDLLQDLQPVLSGTLLDWSTNTLSYFPSIKLEWTDTINNFGIILFGSFSKLYTHAINPPSIVQDFSSDSSVQQVGFELSHPLGISFVKAPLAIGIFNLRSDIHGDAAEEQHVYFYESGIVLKADISEFANPVTEINFSISGLWGSESLKGVNFGLGFHF